MKRKFAFLATVAAAVMLVVSAVPVFAADAERFDVIWSEKTDGGVDVIMVSEQDGSVTDMTLDTELIAKESADSYCPNYDEFIETGRLPAGSVLAIEYQSDLKNTAKITVLSDMCRITAARAEEILSDIEPGGHTIPEEEAWDFPVETEFTVLSTKYDGESGTYRMLVSSRSCHFATSVSQYYWYDTTSEIRFKADGTGSVTVCSDGSEIGDALLKSVKAGEPIPSGTVVDILWSGIVLEVYPPDLANVLNITFTDRATDYTEEYAEQCLAGLKDMGYDHELSEDGKFAEKLFMSVNSCEMDGNIAKMELEYAGRPLSLTVDPEKTAVLMGEGADDVYGAFLAGSPLPEGTAVEVVSSDDDPVEITILAVMRAEPIINDTDGAEENPKTGLGSTAVALAGIMIWTACAAGKIRADRSSSRR